MGNTPQAELRPVAPPWKRYWPAGLAICCGLGFSLAVFFVLQGWESRDIETAFCNEAADRSAAVKSVFETQMTMLELVRSAFAGTGRLRRDEYQELLTPFLDHARSIVAVEWIPRVPDSRRREYEDAAKREGVEGFQITELDTRGQIVRAAKRSQYFPVYFMGPGPGDPNVFGYDLASEPTRLDTLRQARDTGKSVASGRITFIEDRTIRNGFLILLPVYEKSKSIESLDDRRRHFQGVVAGVFRPDAMIESALAPLQPEGIDVCIFDPSTSAEKRPFYFHPSRIGKKSRAVENPNRLDDVKAMHYQAGLEVAGHPWSIVCIAASDFIAVRQTWWPWATLAAGMAFTAMFAAYIMSSLDRRAYAERLVHEKRLYARELETKVYQRTEALRLAQEEIIHRLVAASLWRDQETGMHIRRTGLFSEALAKAAGWSAAEAERLRLAAPMHDVGKIGIPDAVLRKPGKLTPEEFEVMKTHTLIGAEMLADSKVPMLQMAREIALHHHERWDGQGYPAGLSGQYIPESARIVAIVDMYDALTHDRVYRRTMPDDEAAALMQQSAGKHFEPALLALFFTILPEIARISEEHPDEIQTDLQLARSFASILARSNLVGAEVSLTADAGCSQPLD